MHVAAKLICTTLTLYLSPHDIGLKSGMKILVTGFNPPGICLLLSLLVLLLKPMLDLFIPLVLFFSNAFGLLLKVLLLA